MTSYLLKRPLGVLTACLCLLILGGFALLTMPINLYPHTQFPVLTMTTVLSDSSPEEIETLITKPIEEAVADISGLRKIQSLSHAGESEITLQFHYGRDISEKALEVRSRIRRLFPLLPKDARFPAITRYDPSDAPVVVLAITGKTSQEEAGEWVHRTLKPRLSRIDGVATVRVAGAPKKQINVDCDPGRLNALSLTIHDVMDAIKASHAGLPAGFLTTKDRRLSVVTAGKLETAADVEHQPVRVTENGQAIRVGQLARVEIGTEDPREITRYNGESLITVAIYRSTDADLRRVSKEVQSALDEVRVDDNKVPTIQVVTNQAAELETILRRLVMMTAMTGAITSCVLFLFLGNLMTTLIVLSAIPFSLLLTVLLMRLFGLTFDLLSLGGLTLGLGILVDNAIVVVESISRKWTEETALTKGIIAGTDDVALPLCLSTLTTIIVFIPVVFISREVRMLFSGFSLTVASSLLASLVASLVFVPVLLRYLGNKRDLLSRRNFINFPALSDRYAAVLALVKKSPGVVIVAACAFLSVSMFFAKGLTFRETLPSDSHRFRIFMVLAPGTSKESTAKEAQKVEKLLLALPWTAGVHTEAQGNQGRFTVSVKPREWFDGSYSVETTTEQIKQVLKTVQGVQFHVVPVGRQGDESKISLNIQGPSPDRLDGAQDRVTRALQKVPGVKDVIVQQGNPAPVVEFPVQHEAVGFLGIAAKDMAYHLRSHLTGPVAAKIIGKEESSTSIRVRAMRSREEGLEAVQQGTVPTDRREMVPFMGLGQPTIRLARGELSRENRRPVMRMTLILDKSDPLEVSENIKTVLDKLLVGSGCDYSFGDEIQNIVRTKKEMMGATVTGLVLIYLILIVATESLALPLLIMTAVPLGAAGAVIGLESFGIAVSLPVYVGMMILCGLIVNVNVVMTYTINQLVRKGVSVDEAVAAGAQRRFRAIVMTVLTTFFATLPMLVDRGAGSSLWSTFALTIASGIISGAVFSLLITPVLYLGIDRLRQRF
jgi:HAE1 family hydrophobic/amphiphilic exporter-1